MGEHSMSEHATSRRTAIYGAAVVGVAVPLLAACDDDTADVTGSGGPGGTASTPADAGSGGGGSSGGITVKASDVPEGGGTILEQQKLVVTQPEPGEYKAFSAVCTHQQCLVAQVKDGEILCPCHFSRFSIDDGSVVDGPAPTSLAERTVTVNGDELSIA